MRGKTGTLAALIEAQNRKRIEFEEDMAERNVLITKIAGLEKTAKEQAEQLTKLNQQLEKAYQKIEDVAVKTIEGTSQAKAYGELQQLLADQFRKTSVDK